MPLLFSKKGVAGGANLTDRKLLAAHSQRARASTSGTAARDTGSIVSSSTVRYSPCTGVFDLPWHIEYAMEVE